MSKDNIQNNGAKKKVSLEAREQMIMDLHEQFAINHNSTLQSLTTFFIALLAVIGTYGLKAYDILISCSCSRRYALIFLSIACSVVLVIICYICIFQGYKFRAEQAVIDRIRSYFDDEKEIFGKQGIVPWSASGKTFCNFIPGLYGVFLRITCIVIFLLNVSSICILTYPDCWTTPLIWYLVGSIIFSWLIVFIFKVRYYEKYMNKMDAKEESRKCRIYNLYMKLKKPFKRQKIDS